MTHPTHLHAGRRMHRVAPEDQCCTGDCQQGRTCPRYQEGPIKSQPIIGTAPFVWTGVILLVIAMASGILYLVKGIAA